MNNRFNFSIPFEDPVLIFALVMLIILLAPIFFKKMKIPGLVGLILAGTVVGPGMLGLIDRDFTIVLLGTVGLLYLMFMAGLSIDLNRFEKLKEKSIGFGFFSFIFPMLAAIYVGIEFLDFSLSTSLLLGSIVGSHTLLAYPIAERLGITKNTGVTMSMGGTLVTDTLSLGVLAVVAGSVGDDQGTGYWVGFATSVGIFVAAALIILPKLGRWFFRNIQYEKNIDFVFMVAVLFTTAFFAELAGLASIIGAFMAGLLLNRLVPSSGTLMSRVQFVGNALFIPFFLISVGMLVDISVLGSLEVWVIAIIFSLLVFFGKGLAALVVRFLFKFSNEEALVVYGLTTPQSAATLAVTLVGYELGFFDTTAVNAVVIMILITCLVGPYLVEKYGRAVAIQEDGKPYEPSEAPQRILVPLANPETSDALMDIAFMVRDDKFGQPINPLTVARGGPDLDAQVARGEKMLSHAVIHAAAAEVPVNPVTRVDLNISKGIARAVNEMRITNIIIGWNGKVSTKRSVFGTILDQLLKEVDEMVMVSKIERPVNTFNRIVVAIPPYAAMESGFNSSIRSIKLLAEQIGGELEIVATHDREEYVKNRIETIKPVLDFSCNSLTQWSELPGWLEENRNEDDLFILISAREGSLSWRPGLDRLPRVIAQRYPELSFITVYPSEVEVEAIKSALLLDGNELIKPHRVKIGLKQAPINEILEQILVNDDAFEDIDLRRITRRLLEYTSDYTPEVMPGVMLFESHTSKVDEQLLFVGISEKALNVEQTANPVHVVLVILSPKFIKAEDHLKGLNRIVKLIKPGDDVSQLKVAKSEQDVVKFLVERLKS
jgi:Kef-type K+ transport system membrane component KefB/mannitol/fructose-specific phosphotransferase system IIA component (Ntr-type)